MTRPIRAILLALCLTVATAVPALAQTTFTLDGHFREGFGRAASSEPCDLAPPFCGSGNVRGLGDATTLDFEDDTKTITLVSDGSTLVMNEEFVSFTTPGGSGEAPGMLVSFGNPFFLVVSWEADAEASTGIFEGATGSGITTTTGAGDVLIVDTNGTLILAD